jgi:hypothetical protein
MIECLKENDPKVRFSALEVIFYCIESYGDICLLALNELFETILTALADYDEDVKKASLALDRSLQSIVESNFHS